MTSSFVGKLALVAAILGLAGSSARAAFNPPIKTAAFSVEGNPANVTVNGKPYDPKTTILTAGDKVAVSGSDTKLKIGTTEITASAGTSLTLNEGKTASTDDKTLPTFSVGSGSIVFAGKTLTSGSVLSIDNNQATAAVNAATASAAASNNQAGGQYYYEIESGKASEWETVVLEPAPPSPEQNTKVVSPSAP